MPAWQDFTNTRIILRLGTTELSPTPLLSQSYQNIQIGDDPRQFTEVTYSFTGFLIDDTSSGVTTLYQRKDDLQTAISGNTIYVFKYGPGSINYPSGTVLESGFGFTNNLSFQEGTWSDRLQYSFDLIFRKQFDPSVSGITDINEGWDWQEVEDNIDVLECTHTLSARGLNTNQHYGDNALANAQAYVLSRITTGVFPTNLTIPDFVIGSGSTYSEAARSVNIDFINKVYGINQRFTRSSGVYDHRYTAQLSEDKEGIVAVNLNGRVRGFGRKHNAYTYAESGWLNNVKNALPNEASGVYVGLGYSGLLNTTNNTSLSITRNMDAGTIEYSITYDDDPSNNLPSGISETSIEKSITPGLRQYVLFPIPRSLLGPTVQDIGTSNEWNISIQGSVTATNDSDIENARTYATTRVNNIRPLPQDYLTLYLSSKQQTENTDDKRFSFNLGWTATRSLSSSPSPSGLINFD